MAKKYTEYKQLNLPEVADEILAFWEENDIFKKSIETREGQEPFVFYEGPPSANGMPGIHHVMARTIKDIFCRYRTLKGYQVKRKAGWDTHGLPIELGVEKELGITKEDIGKTITIADYNDACRKAVMKYTDVWNDLTRKIGYWVDMEHPYVTYDNKYIESVWWLLKNLYEKDLLYKGYTIQPYSPKAGTGLSSHELNQPGTYRDVKDTTVVAQFYLPLTPSKGGGNPKILETLRDAADSLPMGEGRGGVYILAWTTTPWTLPSNTALAVGEKIDYVAVKSFNQYTFEPTIVIMAKDLVGKWFKEENAELSFEEYNAGDKKIPYEIVAEFKGSDLVGTAYEQLMPYAQPDGEGFKVIAGDFVSTEDGTGIVHIAPTFGADDARVAKIAGMGAMLVDDGEGNQVPLVDLQGRFRPEVTDFAGEYVKAEYYSDAEIEAETKKQGRDNYLSVDERIAIKLKEENKAFRVEKYEHSYPHCWRTDKPILYYPLDSWFIKTTAAKDRLIELNKTINWKPESTGTGRFGNWLENLQDWNLSRSRFWGIPLPIWSTEDKKERKCIGSVEELKAECDKAVAAGLMKTNPMVDFQAGNMDASNYGVFDLHRPYMDDVVLVSESGQPMNREADLIDVWFDSGAMPYAQLHYPFENKELIDGKSYFPADFIAEGVDQTRGWFFTLHAIGTMCFDSVAYKNVVSNGLVLDKNGQKMSKRLGNAVDPFETLKKYGPDATRWYMITNAEPWDNLKFDIEGIGEVQRKFFGTLYNTYGFYALYANIDGYDFSEAEVPLDQRPEIDRWVMSKLNSLVAEVDEHYMAFEPKKAGRAIQEFVNENLSNWYVRLCRRRFWKGEASIDKSSAYQTLYTCLETVAKLMSPIAPFYADRLFLDLNAVTGRDKSESIHLSEMPSADKNAIDLDLEERMAIAQKTTSLILSIRKKESHRVRQPLAKVMIPILNEKFERQLRAVEDLILSEVNVKELEYLKETAGVIEKTIKANFKTLGPKYGKQMKQIAGAIAQMNQTDISAFEAAGTFELTIDGSPLSISLEDAEIISKDIPGWAVASEGGITVALDLTITAALEQEGLARELVNRIQNLRKEKGFEVTDRISLSILDAQPIKDAVTNNLKYICAETLAGTLELVPVLSADNSVVVDLIGDLKTQISISTLN
ncbi:MAG: isoleucine--tRNA ligase [Flavobacteriales bacterium]|nr:isoleucine--tRNA ligase [Flavobacteriales bacterium]